MADIRPFRAVRYSQPIEPVLAPPYDVLNDDQVAMFKARSKHNVVHLTRPGQDYEGAARCFQQWLAEGTLVQEDRPAAYLHETAFDGRVRRDLIAALRLQPYQDGVVLPHERTHRGAKEDRLALFRATGASFEPLWFLSEGLTELLWSAPQGDTACFSFEGYEHSLRRIDDEPWLNAMARSLAKRPVLIADGHHRYETTLAYSQDLGGATDAASRFTLALLTDLDDPGLVVLPTHRVLKAGITVTGGQPAASLGDMMEAIEGRVAAGYYRDGNFQVLPLEGEIAVLELHRQVIDNILGERDPETSIAYTRDAAEAVRWVDEGQGLAAFFLGRPDLGAVLTAARLGMSMPQKTTYFFPKPPSGMLFHRLTPGRLLEK
jgi:uncharacterized protein (DUF1015 family)